MSSKMFSSVNFPVSLLVGQIENGQLGLPDLQRPFVWDRAKVRDLFDSLYRGYPAGYFLFWSTGADHAAHSIGEGEKQPPLKMIVDGQQRLTSLYAVLTGAKVKNEDNEYNQIRIAFHPLRERFSVADGSTDKSHEWISNISDLFSNDRGTFGFINDYLASLREHRDVTPDEERAIGDNIGRVYSLRGYVFPALDLSADLDVEEVAEVFVRINSKGVSLNNADFILTLMSVYRDDARHQLEDFAIAAKVPSVGSTPSPYNYFLTPSPDQLLRVAVGLAFKRGVLKYAYQVLRGKDLETGEVSPEARETQFEAYEQAQAHVLNLTNWHEYMTAVKRAGYRSGAMLTSDNNFLYCYLFYLIGRHEYGVKGPELKDAIARWFFMSSLTGRYTGSPETQVESDLRRFDEAVTAQDFVDVLMDTVETELTSDYFRVTLPERLDSSAAWSPYLFAYYAALNLLGAKALFSPLKISDLFDPGVSGTKSPIEKHHLFPKSYLADIGIKGTTRTNAIANFAFVEWADNAAISDTKPSEYFPPLFEALSPADQEQALFWHALPKNWHDMEYGDFVKERRQLMADVVKAGYEKLRDGKSPFDDLAGSPEPPSTLPTVADLIEEMETEQIEFKSTARYSLKPEIPEKVINEGVIKTVAAFMNSEGGTLAIGVTDDGEILGVRPDLEMKHQDLDQYQNWLTTLLINSIGGGLSAAHTSTRFEHIGPETVCLVDVRPSSEPVYAKTTKGDHVFYVRHGNTTRILEGPELDKYKRGRET